MGDFTLLDHTADIGLQASGDDWGDLLRQAALAVLQVIGAQSETAVEQTLHIEVSGNDREELLINWLNELLFYIEVRHLVPCQVTMEAVAADRLAAVLGVIPIDAVTSFAHEVKSATYHRIVVQEQPGGGWLARVYLDL